MTKPKLAIIGAGKLGITLAQLALKAGYSVTLAGSGDPDKIRLSVRVLAVGAEVATTEEAVGGADIVILALPLRAYRSLNPKWFHAQALVIDAMNYWWETDGRNNSLTDPTISTSEIIQNHLQYSRISKALSHVGYHDLRDFSTHNSNSAPIAIAFAGPSQDQQIIKSLISDLGFEPHYLGDLPEGKRLQPGSPVFGAHLAKDAFITALVTESSA